MNSKICSKCTNEKSLTEYNRKGDRYQCYCRVCQHDEQKKHYSKNKQWYRERVKAQTKKLREFIQLQKTKCEQCGENHPGVLDFHHINPEEKEINIGLAVIYGWSIKRLAKEIEKCVVLCSNCHRKLHWEERNTE